MLFWQKCQRVEGEEGKGTYIGEVPQENAHEESRHRKSKRERESTRQERKEA
jgi:hypothetical protein